MDHRFKLFKKPAAALLAAAVFVGALPFAAFAADDTEDTSEKIVEITTENFPDYSFRNFANAQDTNKDGWLSQNEINEVTQIYSGMAVKDYTGVEYFTELTSFRITNGSDTKALDLSRNTKLTVINVGTTKITKIDLSKNTELRELRFVDSKLTALDVSHNKKLTSLECRDNNISALDLSNNPELTYLECSRNAIASFNITGCTKLQKIWCSNNKISGLYDLTEMPDLIEAMFYSNNGASLKIDGLQNLEKVSLAGNGLTSFSVKNCPALINLSLENNNLTSFSSENCPLTTLTLSDNQLTNIDNVKTERIENLKIDNNKLTHLNTESFPRLSLLWCDNNQIESLDFSLNPLLYWLHCSGNRLTKLEIHDTGKNLGDVICSDNPIKELNLSGERLGVVHCDNAQLTSFNINAPNLRELHLENNALEEIDISGYLRLTDLYVRNNKLKKLELAKNYEELMRVFCENNNLTAIHADANKLLSKTYSSDYYCIWAKGNTFQIEPNENGQYDLSKLSAVSGFDVSRASNWTGGTVNGNILTVTPGAKAVTYTYTMKPATEDRAALTETFTLLPPKTECTHESTSVVGAKAATCKDTGYTGDTVCDDCKEVVKPGTVIAIDPKNHVGKTSVVNKKAATCTKKGYTGDTVCDGCKAVLKKGTETALKAHTLKTTVTKATTVKDGKITKACTVCKKTISATTIYKASKVTLSTTKYTYNGKVKTPTVTVKTSKGKTLKKNTDYTVSYAKGRKYVGKYAVKITFKGNYTGTKTLYFTINPKGTSLKSVKAGKKSFTAKWSAQKSQTSGYQIQYSTSKSFKGAKTVTISKNKTTSKTVKSLKANKKYYVRMRTYKTVGKTKYYSGWSGYKTVKTKK